MNRTVLIAVPAVIIIVLAIILLARLERSPAAISCAAAHPIVVAFGDSLVKGYGAPAGQDFVSGLSQKTGIPILNLGVSGNTTSDGLMRVGQVLTANPDIVIVLLGGNDALQQVPIEKTRANLDKILQTILSYQGKPIRVILVGVVGGFLNDPYASMFQELAQTYGVTYVPNILSGLITDPQYMSDQVHPNAAGYAKIADRLYPILEHVCGSLPAQH